MLVFQIIVFGFAWWLGLYLLVRNIRRAALCLAGCGIIAYALGLACTVLSEVAAAGNGTALARAGAVLLLLPATCWAGTILELLPTSTSLRDRLVVLWRGVLPPLIVLVVVLGISTDLLITTVDGQVAAGPLYLPIALMLWLPLAGAFLLMARAYFTGQLGKRRGLVLAVLVLFLISSGALATLVGGIPRSLMILLIGVDLVLLDIAIAVLDAFDEGETLLPDITRSFVAAAVAALFFGGQVVLALVAGLPLSVATLTLLLTTVASAIALITLTSPIAALLDRVVFVRRASLQQARSDLRVVADVLPRMDVGLDLAQLDDAELTRVTRRALSHYGDLARLASNPLTQLPGLIGQDRSADQLERAVALKALLAASIERLKPQSGDDFGTSDEWRYYNVLHFPYVVGLKPYSRRTNLDGLDEVTRRALEWFHSSVPERTLYNWQTAAARLVAQDLRSRQNNGAH